MKLNIGIIGCGNIARTVHLPILVKNPDINNIFLSDIDSKLMNEVGEQFGIEKRNMVEDYHQLLDMVDAVFILTPPHTHYVIVMESLKHGKHVFVEKPMCLESVEANDIRKLTESTGLNVTTGYNLRFMPQLKLAKDFLKKGHIGKVVTVNGYYLAEAPYLRKNKSFYLDKGKGGGVLMDGLCHLIDASSWLMESSIIEACGFTGSYDDLPVENIADISIKFDNGAIGHLQAIWAPLSEYLHTSELKSLKVIGDKGFIAPELYSGRIKEYRSGKGTNIIYPKNAQLRNPMWALNRSYLEQDTFFLENIKKRKANPEILNISVQIVEILDAIKKEGKYKKK